jgi:hypothetical protein
MSRCTASKTAMTPSSSSRCDISAKRGTRTSKGHRQVLAPLSANTDIRSSAAIRRKMADGCYWEMASMFRLHYVAHLPLTAALSLAACSESAPTAPGAALATGCPPVSGTPVARTGMTDVGGFGLYADVQGQQVAGRPTVVFDSGAGEDHTVWQGTEVTAPASASPTRATCPRRRSSRRASCMRCCKPTTCRRRISWSGTRSPA